MMNAFAAMLVWTALGQVAVEQRYPDPEANPTFENASIRSQDDIRVYAEVEGVLIKLPVREGARITAGQVLATIDDRQAQAAVEVADLTHQAAVKRAEDTIEEQYAVKAAEVAKVDWERSLAANEIATNAISDIEVRQKKLVFQRSELQTEKALNDQVLAGKDAAVKKAELKAAKINLDRRTIRAPFDGEVQQLFLHEAEWANPGDPILRLVRFDTMQVDCYVDSRLYDPVDLENRKVTVHVNLARGNEAAVLGRVIYINQIVQAGDAKYLVRAEVENQRKGDYWLIRPGLPASMTIHLNEKAEGAAVQSTRRKSPAPK